MCPWCLAQDNKESPPAPVQVVLSSFVPCCCCSSLQPARLLGIPSEPSQCLLVLRQKSQVVAGVSHALGLVLRAGRGHAGFGALSALSCLCIFLVHARAEPQQ